MELIPGSETSTHLIQTPGIYPKENTLHQQHGESLKTKNLNLTLVLIIHGQFGTAGRNYGFLITAIQFGVLY
jgi:hypothetical protein